MINPEYELTITRQAQLLGISRGSLYYLPRPVSAADLVLMQRIDRLHLEHPFIRELHIASVGSSQATTAAVDSAPVATCPQSTYKSGKVVQIGGATSFGELSIHQIDRCPHTFIGVPFVAIVGAEDVVNWHAPEQFSALCLLLNCTLRPLPANFRGSSWFGYPGRNGQGDSVWSPPIRRTAFLRLRHIVAETIA